MRLLVTGGCGFIGSNFVRYVLDHYHPEFVTNVDALTGAGSVSNVEGLAAQYGARYEFLHGDIANTDLMDELMRKHRFYAVVNFAAEFHVDRSINSPQHFIHTNVAGAGVLLDAARRHGVRRFIQISTDEVYGSPGTEGRSGEAAPLAPSSAYAASKAGADLVALAFHKTYGMEVVVTRCSNNYGPFQFPDKLIPRTILSAIQGRRVPVHGDGGQVRGWIHVEDHCAAIVAVALNGRAGEVYNIGADAEFAEIEIVHRILAHLGQPRELIEFVQDLPGHDLRRAVDTAKIRTELGWKPLHRIEEALPATIDWYLANRPWWEKLAP